jgi:hypothetical protein
MIMKTLLVLPTQQVVLPGNPVKIEIDASHVSSYELARILADDRESKIEFGIIPLIEPLSGQSNMDNLHEFGTTARLIGVRQKGSTISLTVQGIFKRVTHTGIKDLKGSRLTHLHKTTRQSPPVLL